jgi:signal transduction histidine kinase
VLKNSRLFHQAQHSRERLQLLSQRLVEAQEVERHRIARELHDEIGQTLTAVKINLQGLQQLPPGTEFQSRLLDSIDIAEHALQQVRTLSLDLRPSLLDDLGLIATLRWYLKRQAKWGSFTTKFIAEPGEIALPPELEITCFRVAQEALTNVMRHAQAQQVRVELQQRQGELVLTIVDDGIGFDVQPTLDKAVQGISLGLLGIQERVMFVDGQLKIESQPGCGTKLEAHFPLSASTTPSVTADNAVREANV